jgi:hypothetical protein
LKIFSKSSNSTPTLIERLGVINENIENKKINKKSFRKSILFQKSHINKLKNQS